MDFIKKIILKIKLYFQFFKFIKSQGGSQEKPVDDPVVDPVYLKLNDTSLKFLEWADFGNMKLPMYYFIKDGQKYYYLQYFDKTINVDGENKRMFLVDKNITTMN